MNRTPSTSCFSSPVVSEAGTSGPKHSRLNVTCTSRASAPSAAAASPAQIVPGVVREPAAQP